MLFVLIARQRLGNLFEDAAETKAIHVDVCPGFRTGVLLAGVLQKLDGLKNVRFWCGDFSLESVTYHGESFIPAV